MGTFIRVYGFGSVSDHSLPGEMGNDTVKRLVTAAACNQGYTPDGEPTFSWNTATRRVKATLPVTERTMPDGR